MCNLHSCCTFCIGVSLELHYSQLIRIEYFLLVYCYFLLIWSIKVSKISFDSINGVSLLSCTLLVQHTHKMYSVELKEEFVFKTKRISIPIVLFLSSSGLYKPSVVYRRQLCQC